MTLQINDPYFSPPGGIDDFLEFGGNALDHARLANSRRTDQRCAAQFGIPAAKPLLPFDQNLKNTIPEFFEVLRFEKLGFKVDL
ncbi:hypothetical protein [Ruegeria arenilitoris]|uniref:hypothetical protein n=1 Tax=Ruegeria arenilitoris TaxID=1173585 RepID=UPI00147C9902|nr:hypothetical protein [Ruegeria arenilitoris]